MKLSSSIEDARRQSHGEESSVKIPASERNYMEGKKKKNKKRKGISRGLFMTDIDKTVGFFPHQQIGRMFNCNS